MSTTTESCDVAPPRITLDLLVEQDRERSYHAGFDVGYEAGYEDAMSDADDTLIELRAEVARLKGHSGPLAEWGRELLGYGQPAYAVGDRVRIVKDGPAFGDNTDPDEPLRLHPCGALPIEGTITALDADFGRFGKLIEVGLSGGGRKYVRPVQIERA